jgi:hypothetical protein
MPGTLAFETLSDELVQYRVLEASLPLIKVSRNTLKHVKSVISGIFTLAKQQDYFQGENPARDSAVKPKAAEPQETYAYTLEEVQTILALLPEPAATAFAVAGYMG